MRTGFTDTFTGSGITKGGFKYVIDPFLLTQKVADPTDANSLISGFAQILLPVTLSDAQILQLKNELIPGLPDSTWTFEWNKYTVNPTDTTQKNTISKKLMTLLKAILRMPEFYLA
jgi:hypothetical protein